MKGVIPCLTIFVCLLFSISSCKKNKNDGLPIGQVPEIFKQKILFEEFTGEWCGWCPEAANVRDSLIAINPNKIVAVAVHDGDPMERTSYNEYLKNLANLSGYPSATINRSKAEGAGVWANYLQNNLSENTNTGIAIQTTRNAQLIDVDVYVGYANPINVDARITIALIEDKVAQSSPDAQANFSSDIITDASWQHRYVFRGTLTDIAGTPISLTDTEKRYSKISFSEVDINTFHPNVVSNLYIVAFLTNASGKNVMNVQQVKVGEFQDWQ